MTLSARTIQRGTRTVSTNACRFSSFSSRTLSSQQLLKVSSIRPMLTPASGGLYNQRPACKHAAAREGGRATRTGACGSGAGPAEGNERLSERAARATRVQAPPRGSKRHGERQVGGRPTPETGGRPTPKEPTREPQPSQRDESNGFDRGDGRLDWALQRTWLQLRRRRSHSRHTKPLLPALQRRAGERQWGLPRGRASDPKALINMNRGPA